MVGDLSLDDISVCERQSRFWSHFGFDPTGPDFAGQKVLDLGCGEGRQCLAIANRGARRVVGLDPRSESVQIAAENLRKYPSLASVIEYCVGTVHELAEDDFDAVVSQDAFEHVLDLPETLDGIRRVLRPGGRAYIGFGPLFHSPFGDHGHMRAALPLRGHFSLPWGYLLVPERWLFRRMEARYGKPVRNTIDWPFLALNKKTAAEFRRLFLDSGMRVVMGRSNANFSWKARLFGLFSKVPVFDKYFTLGMYYILEK